MKFATLQDGSRDGQLVVVSRDLASAHYASGIAQRLQQVLDDWGFMSPQLQDLYDELNAGRARHAFPFDPAQCLAPLPRAFQWVRGDAFLEPAWRVRQLRADTPAESPPAEPTLRHDGSDGFLGPREPVAVMDDARGVDFGGALAVVTGDVRRGATPEQAIDGVRLVMLVNDTSVGEAQSDRLASAFGPVAVTPSEFGDAWRGGRVHLTLQSSVNGRKVGLCDAAADMHFDFGRLVAHLARHRDVRAGSIVGSGTVGNQGVVRKDGRIDWPRGYGCIAEKRAMETLQDGAPVTGFLRVGDSVRIELKGADGKAALGAIEQEVISLDGASRDSQGSRRPHASA